MYKKIHELTWIVFQEDTKTIRNFLTLDDAQKSILILKIIYQKILKENPNLINIFKKKEKNAEMFDKLLK
jgi:hemoglobin-like flavoprotein